jgi:hypothetical protein
MPFTPGSGNATQQFSTGAGPFAFAGSNGEVLQQIIDDFVTRRELQMNAVITYPDGMYFKDGIGTWLMQTGRHINSTSLKHSWFQRRSRFRAAAISVIGSPSSGLVTLTINTAYVSNIGTSGSPTYVSPGIIRQLVFHGKSGNYGQITAVSKPTNSNVHTITVQFVSTGVVSGLTVGDKIGFHGFPSSEKDTYPQGESQTDSRFDAIFEYVMTSRPEISMQAHSAQKAYEVDGQSYEGLIAWKDTYMRHEIYKGLEFLLGDGTALTNGSYGARTRTLGLIPNIRAFGASNLTCDLSSRANVLAYLLDIARYARGAGGMGPEMMHLLGLNFKAGLQNALDDGSATNTNMRYNAFGSDADAQKRGLNLGFNSINEGITGFTHHLKAVNEYGHVELMDTVTATTQLNGSFYEQSDTVLPAGQGGNGPNRNTFAVGDITPEISMINFVQRDGKNNTTTQARIYIDQAIKGYQADSETITEEFACKIANAQAGMFAIRTA